MTTGPYHTIASPAAAAVAASARRLPGESRCPHSANSARVTPPLPVPHRHSAPAHKQAGSPHRPAISHHSARAP